MIRQDLLKLLSSIEDLEDVNFETAKDLVTSGTLDSYTILVMVTQIERQFAVQLEIEGGLSDNFDSLEKMERLITASRAHQQKTS